MTFKQMAIPPNEAQFLETRKFQINEIARIFRVPPHMVGDLEKSSFSNIEQQSLDFVMYTLNPWIVRWEQAMQQSLLLPSEKGRLSFRFNVDGLLRGDYQSRMNGYAVARQNGWMSANDIRELENMNPIPDEEGGNLYLINGNLKTQDCLDSLQEGMITMSRKFWNWVRNDNEDRILILNGEISNETWYGDEITPQIFRSELNSGQGKVTVWINSPGGDCFAAAQIYNMLMEYPGCVDVHIDGIAASTASVIAMAGNHVAISPVGMMMIHNPATVSIGDEREMKKAMDMLSEVKESIINAYEIKTGLPRKQLSNMIMQSPGSMPERLWSWGLRIVSCTMAMMTMTLKMRV